MLTNGNTPVSKSAAQQRYAERKAQPAQQGDNAVATQQGEQHADFKKAEEILRYRCDDYILNTTDPRLADVRERLAEPGAEVDSSYVLHDGVIEFIIMAIVYVCVLGGEELRKQRDSLEFLTESPLFGPIFSDIFGHLETVTMTGAKGGVTYWQQDSQNMQVAQVTTTLKEVQKAVELNGGIPVLVEKPEYSLEAGNRVGFTLEDRGFIWMTTKLHELLGNTSTQLFKGGSFSSAIRSQQETVMPADTLDTARMVRFFTIKHKMISFFRGMYDIQESGFLNMLNWNVAYLSDPFPVDNVESVYKFDQMLEHHSEDFYALCSGGDVSPEFLKKYGNLEVHAYVFRRAVSGGDNADKALSLPTKVYKMAKDGAEAKAEPVESETEVKAEPEAKPAAKKPAARKATKKTTSSKAKAKAETKAAEEATSQAEAKAEDENQNIPF